MVEAREKLSFLEINPELFLRESLHRVGYSGALGNPLYPTTEALGRIDRGAIRNFFLVTNFFCACVHHIHPLYTSFGQSCDVCTSIYKCEKATIITCL